MTMNRLSNTKNPYQGTAKKVLCVCSGGLLRSPTAAEVLSREPFNFNTRACGISDEFSLILVDDVLLEWADELVCFDVNAQIGLKERTKKPVINLSIPDRFAFRDKELVSTIAERYVQAVKEQGGAA